MKKFEEIKKDAIELKDKTVSFCKEHKEGIKNAAIFVGGAALSYVLTKDYYTPRTGEPTITRAVTYESDGAVGYVDMTYNKHGRERKQLRNKIAFDSPDAALEFGKNMIRHAKAAKGEYGRYIWEPDNKSKEEIMEMAENLSRKKSSL